MEIVNLVTEQLKSKAILTQIGKTVGAKPAQVKKVTELGLPTLVKAMQRNVSTPAGAAALDKALTDHQNAPVEELAGFLENVDLENGAKILKHVFPGADQKVQSNLAQQVGLKTDQVSGIMAQLAPLLLGALGNQKKEKKLGASGVSDLLETLATALGGGGLGSIISSILGGDGSKDLLGQVGGILGDLLTGAPKKAAPKAKTAKKAKTAGTKTAKTIKKTKTKTAPVKKITKTVKKIIKP